MGDNAGGRVTACYARGTVSGNSEYTIGGLVGGNFGGSYGAIEDSYYSLDANIMNGGTGDTNALGAGKTAFDLRFPTAFGTKVGPFIIAGTEICMANWTKMIRTLYGISVRAISILC